MFSDTARTESCSEMSRLSRLTSNHSLTPSLSSSSATIQPQNPVYLEDEVASLEILLTAGLVASTHSSSAMQWLSRFVRANVLLVGLGAAVYVPITAFVTREHSSSVILIAGRMLFTIFTTVMYMYISHMAKSSPGIVALIREVGSRETNNKHASPCSTKYPITAIVAVVMILCVSNVVVIIFSPEILISLLGLTNHRLFIVYLEVVVYFLSFAWMASIPFVYLGCKLLTEKVKFLIAHVTTEFRSEREEPVDLFFVMEWYDELYEKNRLLTEAISGVVTLTIMFLATASTLIAIHIAIVGPNTNDVFWFFSNFFILVATCYPVAELEIQNKLLSIELGALPMPKSVVDFNLYLNLFQTCTIKTSRSQFGIFVMGTKFRITFSALVRVGSITLSAIIFLAGALRVIGR
jgi:hypothetical protein